MIKSCTLICNKLKNFSEVIPIEVRINKEVRDYQESLFFGLSLRQFLFALLAVLVAVGLYFGLRNVVGSGEIGWICVLAAFPFALCGFFTYNGMTFLLAVIRSELLYPRKAEEFARGAREAGNQVEKIELYDKTIG